MRSDDKRYTLVFNGEIYNYVELKELLIKEGIIFASSSDTEVYLSYYKKGFKGTRLS